jgi:hypothetical protein
MRSTYYFAECRRNPFFIRDDVKLGPQITHCGTTIGGGGVVAAAAPMDAASQAMLVMKVRKEPKEAIKVSEVTASHYIMCKSPWSFFHQLQYM